MRVGFVEGVLAVMVFMLLFNVFLGFDDLLGHC